MSFDKNYPNRKDKRKSYRGSRAFDRSCRHGGRCGWCLGNRTYNTRRREAEADGRVE
jgi:hypothetical protein